MPREDWLYWVARSQSRPLPDPWAINGLLMSFLACSFGDKSRPGPEKFIPPFGNDERKGQSDEDFIAMARAIEASQKAAKQQRV